jgi:hypothetical protein
MKVSQAVDYFINYHKANSKKKYDQESDFYIIQIPGRIWRQRIKIHIIG